MPEGTEGSKEENDREKTPKEETEEKAGEEAKELLHGLVSMVAPAKVGAYQYISWSCLFGHCG